MDLKRLRQELKWKLLEFWDLCRHPFLQTAQVISWLPILWRDRDWDHSYLMRIIHHKLNRMADHIDEHDMHTNSKEVAQTIRSVLKAMDDFENSHDVVPKPLNAEAGFKKIPGKRNSEFHCNDEFGKWCDEVNKFEEETWKRIWDTIRDNARGWWC